MDLDEAVADYVGELLGDTAGRADLTSARDARDDVGALAVSRLRRRIAEILMAEGWQPPPDVDLLDGEGPTATSAHVDGDAVRARAQRDASEPTPIRRPSSEIPEASADEVLAAMRSEVQQMRQALRTRATIEQAKGIVMARFGLSAESAWNYLVRTSQQRNVKLRDLAEDLVHSVVEQPPVKGS